MHYEWTGGWPANRAPQVEAMLLDGRTSADSVRVAAGETYEARIDIRDPLYLTIDKFARLLCPQPWLLSDRGL